MSARPTPIRSACKLGQCTYCGFCERFGCGNYAKASPQTAILPALLRFPQFQRCEPSREVTRINLDSTGKHATGVTYVDTSGEEWEQPAEIVVLCAFSLSQRAADAAVGNRQALRSADRAGRRGPQLRLSDHLQRCSLIFEDKILNPFIGTGAHGMSHRRLQRRQLRSQRTRIRRRRLHGRWTDRSAARSRPSRCRRARRNGAREWKKAIARQSTSARSAVAPTAVR